MINNLLKIISFGLISSNALAGNELANIYPYVVPEDYIESIPSEDRKALSWSLGNGIYVMLITHQNNTATNLTIDKLAKFQIKPEDAKKIAIDNLEKLAESGHIKQMAFNGPSGKPFILMGGHWAAATAILLPSLKLMGTKITGATEVLVSIPHREALLLFGNYSDEYVDQMKDMIRTKESGNPRPLTFELFRLRNDELSTYK